MSETLTEEEVKQRAFLKEQAAKVLAYDIARVRREWGAQPAPQIAGVPISRELAGKLGAA